MKEGKIFGVKSKLDQCRIESKAHLLKGFTCEWVEEFQSLRGWKI